MIYLDTSVVSPLFIADAHTVRAYAWFSNVRETLVVGDLTRLEFATELCRSLRTGRVSSDDLIRIFRNFDEFCARHAGHHHSRDDFEEAEELVRDPSTKLSAPDALHLASAMNAGVALAAFDIRLAEAATSKGVELKLKP